MQIPTGRYTGIAVALAAAVAPTAGASETLEAALARACAGNPVIGGERYGLQAKYEDIAIARAGGLPSFSVDANLDQDLLAPSANASGAQATGSRARSFGANPQLSIPLYLGGSIKNQVSAATTRLSSGQALLRGVESDAISRVVRAYMDVRRDEAIAGLSAENVKVLEVNLQATKSRFQVGDLTVTDIAQSEARLAQAKSQLATATSQALTSRERYLQETGSQPVDLQPPPTLTFLPKSAAEATTIALRENPQLRSALLESQARRSDVAVAAATGRPSISVSGDVGYSNYLGSAASLPGQAGNNPGQSRLQGAGTLNATVPIYQGGRPRALVRQAEASQDQAEEQAVLVERSVVAQSRSAFAAWRAAEGVVEASKVAIDANRTSLEGVRIGSGVGTRTILEVLNAEQELLSSEVSLIQAERDAYTTAFDLILLEGVAGREPALSQVGCAIGVRTHP